VISHNFGDADPHPWDSRPPQSYPVHGTDVARFQSSIDWPTARANGVNFVFIKATEGGDLVDPMFREHWQGAARAGIEHGAYHFWYHCRPAAEQAAWFIRNVPRGGLPPVLDLEWTPFSPTCTIRPPAATVRREAQIFMDALTRHYGQKPIIYTSIDFYEDNELRKLTGYDFWLRTVAAHPSQKYPDQKWTFWQYTSTGLIPGAAGKMDINVFNGSAAQWKEWLARRRQK
jgi:lysozyme